MSRKVESARRLGFLAVTIAGAMSCGGSFARPMLDQAMPVPSYETPSMESGAGALANNDPSKARRIFQTLLRQNPHAYAPYIGLSDIEIQGKKYSAAEDWLAQGLDAIPGDSHLLRARAHLADIQGRTKLEASLLARAAAADPGEVKIDLDLAKLYGGALKDPERALALYQAAIKTAPSNADAQYQYAAALAGQNRIADALQVLNDAQSAAPSNPIPSLTAAQIYWRDRQLKEALSKVDKVLEISPGLEAGNLMRGAILQRYGRYQDALDVYGAILKINAKSVSAHLGIGLVQQALGRQDDAVREFQTVIAADPKNVVALNNLAWMAAERKSDLDQARKWIDAAIAERADDAALRDTSGWLFRQSGDLEAARAELRRGLKLSPSASLYYHLGAVDAALGRKEAAIRLLQQALQLEPWMDAAMTALWELDGRSA